tara:strand:- start:46 stop:351 length:306 start_codon:yes stop_codon:yes gene_type:complete
MNGIRFIHFEDAVTDSRYVAVDKIAQIEVTDGDTVKCFFASLDPAVTANDVVEITTASDKADETALLIANACAPGSIGHGNVFKVSDALADVTTVAYTAGS